MVVLLEMARTYAISPMTCCCGSSQRHANSFTSESAFSHMLTADVNWL